jgi:hypothetical protein
VSVCRFGPGGIFSALSDPADRGGADPVAEFQQLAVDPLVSSAVILAGQLLDQHGDLSGDRRAARLVRVSPLPGNQAAVSSQHGPRSDQPLSPQISRAGAGSVRGGPRGRPSPHVVGDGCGAARRPRAAARGAQGPWMPLTCSAGLASCRAGRKSGRAGGETQMIIMDYRQHARPACTACRPKTVCDVNRGLRP